MSLEPKIRLFYAALPDAPTRGLMAAAANALQWDASALPVPQANYHVTLAFVGSIAISRLPDLMEIGASLQGESCTLCFDRYDYWPAPAAIVATAGSVPNSFERLWRALHRKLEQRGCAVDPAPVRAHTTLARKVTQAPVLKAMPSIDWAVAEFSLMSSNTSGMRSAYTVVGTWPLLYSITKR